VKLQLTVRSYEDSTREQLLAEIRHIVQKVAEVHHAPRAPEVKVQENGFPAVYHDPVLTERMRSVFSRLMGPERVRVQSPAMGAEDFGRFAKHFDVPGLQFNVGAAPAASGDGPRPGLHSNKWAPDPEPTLKTGTAAFVRGCLDLLGRR
jgi:hippurate hydrolase